MGQHSLSPSDRKSAASEKPVIGLPKRPGKSKGKPPLMERSSCEDCHWRRRRTLTLPWPPSVYPTSPTRIPSPMRCAKSIPRACSPRTRRLPKPPFFYTTKWLRPRSIRAGSFSSAKKRPKREAPPPFAAPTCFGNGSRRSYPSSAKIV